MIHPYPIVLNARHKQRGYQGPETESMTAKLAMVRVHVRVERNIPVYKVDGHLVDLSFVAIKVGSYSYPTGQQNI